MKESSVDACVTGKRTYETAHLAHKFRRLTVQNNIRRGLINKGALNVYQCKRCNGWHVGHNIWFSQVE